MRRVIGLTVLVLAGLWGGMSAVADEPAQAFLDALRENGYYDVALEYLDSLEGSDLVSEEFKSELSFQRAETLISSVADLRDLTKVDQRLDEAQQLLAEYAQNHESLQVSAKTQQYSGRLLSQRADIYLRQSESERLTVGERKELYGKARTMLESAREDLTAAKDLLTRLLEPSSPDAVRIDPGDPSTLDRRKSLQQSYTQVTVQLPSVIEKLADTYDEGDTTRKQLLLDAVESYMKVWEAYRGYAAGIQACVFAGRCNQKLGKDKEALELFSEVFSLGSGGPLKRFKKQAYVLATDSWGAIDPYPHKEVMFILEPVVRGLTRTEAREPAWLKVQLELAMARYARAQEIRTEGGPTANSDAQTMVRAAAKVLRTVARAPSEYRDRARQLLAEWDIPLTELGENEATPETFGDALQVGRDQIAELESIAAESGQLRRNTAAAEEPATKADLQRQLVEVNQALTDQANQAIAALNLALSLADEQTTSGDINTVRYLQSYAYFASGRLLETTVMAEFLLEKYPREDGSKPASGLLVQSYSQMLDDAPPDDREFETQQLTAACNEIIDRWPGSNEAGLAAATMTRLSLVGGDVQQADEYFASVPSGFSSRGRLALALGQNLWRDYKALVDDGTASESDEATALLKKAIDYMELGVSESTTDSTVSYDTAVGMLLLIDAYLRDGQVDQALKQLDAVNGPLDLVKQQVPAVTRGESGQQYVREAYRTAIKVFLAKMRVDVANQPVWVDRINGILTAMNQAVEASNDPRDQARLAAIYQLIAAEMTAGFDELNDPDRKQQFAKTLSGFLGEVESGSDNGKTVLWAGSTLMKVAASLAESGLSQPADQLYGQATSAFSRAETLGFEGEENAEALGLELRRQRALARRGAGQFEEAVNEFIEIMKAGKAPLSYQIDAANTLQQWGMEKGLSRPIAEATGGTGEMTDPRTNRPTNAIWGWKKMLLATRSNEKFRDTYYLALYKIIEGRLEYGKIENSRRAIESALSELNREVTRDPEFHGMKSWKSRFAELKTRIESELN